MDAKPSASISTFEILGNGGVISRLLPGFEARPQQLEMAERVELALTVNGLLVVEAATGTGKSLAYLVPLALYALRNERPVVVSSSTHVLQDQLIGKDIPLVQRALAEYGVELPAAEAKGMGAYACQRDLESAALGRLVLDTETSESLKAAHEWMKRSMEEHLEGSRSDAPRLSDEVWNEIRVDRDTCTREECSFFETCFFFQARRKMQSARLIVANHSLVFADLAVKEEGGRVLPAYSVLVLDEAHKMEEAATSFLGGEIGAGTLRYTLKRLYGARGGGALARVLDQIPQLKLPAKEKRALPEFIEQQVMPEITNLQFTVDDAFRNIARSWQSIAASSSGAATARALRLTGAVYRHDAFLQAATAGHHLAASMDLVAERLRIAIQRISAAATLFEQRDLAMLRSAQSKLTILASAVRSFFDPMAGAEDTVKWFQPEAARAFGDVRLAMAPLSIAPHLEQRLFKKLDAVILASATLAVGRSFEYFTNRAGLTGEVAPRRSELLLDSPFDLAHRVFAGFPTDLPAPDQAGFLDEAARFLWRVFKVTHGRTLVLFNSWGWLRRTHAILQPHADKLGFRLLAQGEMSKRDLIRAFRDDVHSVLLATSGYREGIDIPGESLTSLVLHRLPFGAPDEPVMEARMEAIERSGGDPFRDYSVPAAAIAFKQAFGRLIRRHSDYGVFFCLDNRVVRKKFGIQFLAALPNCQKVSGASIDVLREAGDFLRKFEGKFKER